MMIINNNYCRCQGPRVATFDGVDYFDMKHQVHSHFNDNTVKKTDISVL